MYRTQVRRRRAVALVVLTSLVGAAVLFVGSMISPARTLRQSSRTASETQTSRTAAATVRSVPAKPVRARPRRPHAVAAGTYGVGMITLKLVDTSRTITLPNGTVIPRPLTTIVRYPTLKKGSGGAAAGAPAARRDGPFPLIIFGHGFNVMPGLYARLLRYWTSAGFVVAAPIFPLTNPHAPGGPKEYDLVNQPRDMSFVITSLLQLSAQHNGRLSGLIDPHEIAATGQSDGGDTALAVAYDPPMRDPRVDAAVILSGAEIPWLASYTIAPGGPPLLATQGTDDDVNLPSATADFYDTAAAPKYLLQLIGAKHLPPYSTNKVQLGVVQRVTTAFLQHYLEHDAAAAQTMLSSGHVPGVATLQADPGTAG